MRRSVTLAASAALALCAAGSAQAATGHAAAKKSCKIATDDAGDTYLVRTVASQSKYQEDALDIISGDLASNATTLTAVVRVVKFAAPPTSSPLGATYSVEFTTSTGADLLYMQANVAPTGTATYDVGTRTSVAVTSTSTSLGAGTGVIDATHNEIRISAPLSLFAAADPIKKGTKLSISNVYTGRSIGARGLFADDATGSKNYVAGTPSCVPVGK